VGAAAAFDAPDAHGHAVAVHGPLGLVFPDVDIALDAGNRLVRDHERITVAMNAEAALNQAAGFPTRLTRRHVPLYWENTSVTRMELKSVRLEIPENGNIIVGQSHFIKTVEDLYEAMVNTAPQIKFGIAFNEASGACLTRVDGNDRELEGNAAKNAQALAAGHVFVIAMRDGYPINVLGRIREIPEICSVFCATANPVEMIVAETEQGCGVLGVIDGSSPQGIESQADVEWRHGLLRKIGYKR